MKIVEKREISEVNTEVLSIKKDTSISSLNIQSKRNFGSSWDELQMELHDKDIGQIVFSIKASTSDQFENLSKLIEAVRVMKNI